MADVDTDELRSLPQRLWARLQPGDDAPTYGWTRFVLLRAIGFVYVVAFAILVHQVGPLLGSDGLLPVGRYLAHVDAGALEAPTIFWLDHSDWLLHGLAWSGLILAMCVTLSGANAPTMVALWAIYLSFVQVGQIFYNYGWEMQLLETGFLAIFLAPTLDPRPFSDRTPPSRAVVWLFRWLAFRIMLGAGLIKLRGGACWSDWTCLLYHFETQPVPNPPSWYLHHLPDWSLKLGVLVNHVVELIVPWLIFGPRRVRHVAGVVLIAFQGMLIASGNLSFLNWLTIVPCLACFDDAFWRSIVPSSWIERASTAAERAEASTLRRWTICALVAAIAMLSIRPVANLASPRQVMNRSYDPLYLVNTYGAFGGVGETRHEIVLQGTDDPSPGPDSEWQSYAFPCKPGPLERRPCWLTPYHYRLDWQVWFAAMGESARGRHWLVHLVYKLLRGDDAVERLLARVPFDDEPPEAIRIVRYVYEFTDEPDDDAWWRRRRVGLYLPPVTLESPSLRRYLTSKEFELDERRH